MIYLRLSFLLILIVSALLLSGASESIKPANPKETEPQSKESQLEQKEPAKQQAPTDKTPIIKQPLHSPPSQQATNSQTSEQKAQTGPPTDPMWWFNLFLVIFTACLVAVGIAQACIYKRQTQYMRRGIRLTRKAANAAEESTRVADASLKFAQRAYLDVSFEEDYVPRPDIPVEINWKISNSGQTRGKITHMDVRFHVASGLPEKIETTNKKRGVIVPGNGHRIPRVGHDRMLSHDETDALFNRRSNLVIYGIILYRDIFNVEHFTRFCWVWDKRARSGKGGFVFPIEADPELNDAD